jgi:hypothetical protein
MNVLRLELEDSTRVKFIVEKPNKWVEVIQENKAQE